jgi:hypothetical protein
LEFNEHVAFAAVPVACAAIPDAMNAECAKMLVGSMIDSLPNMQLDLSC